MKINIKATGIELTPAIASYVEKRVGSLEKYVRATPDALFQVEVGKVTEHHKHGDVFRAEIQITGQGLDLYAAAEESDLTAAIDAVRDDVARTLTREKGRREALYRRGARAVKDMIRGFNPFKKRP
jgi:putative sigma-54 modulation protein